MNVIDISADLWRRLAEAKERVDTANAAVITATARHEAAEQAYADLLAQAGIASVHKPATQTKKGERIKAAYSLRRQGIEKQAEEMGLITSWRACEILEIDIKTLAKTASEGRIKVAHKSNAYGTPNFYHPSEVERYRRRQLGAIEAPTEATEPPQEAAGVSVEIPSARVPEPKQLGEAPPDGWIPTVQAADRLGYSAVEFLRRHKGGEFPEIPQPVSGHWCPESVETVRSLQYGHRKEKA